MRTKELKGVARKVIRILGWLLSILAIVFFVRLIASEGVALSSHSPSEIAGVLALGGTIYGALVCWLAWIWSMLATPHGSNKSRAALCAAYLKSQIAKYIPGNVFQYAARHALGRQLGLDHGALASAAIMEALLLVAGAILIVVAFGQDELRHLVDEAPSVPPWAALPMAFALLAIVAWARRPKWLAWIPKYPFPMLVLALLKYLIFFTGFGGIYAGLLDWTAGHSNDTPHALVCSALAWLLGFIVPGAPAGAGMRESALALAGGSNANVLAAILLFRLVTMIGDLAAFGAGILLSFTLRNRNDTT